MKHVFTVFSLNSPFSIGTTGLATASDTSATNDSEHKVTPKSPPYSSNQIDAVSNGNLIDKKERQLDQNVIID